MTSSDVCEVEVLLDEIGKTLNKTQAQMEPIINKIVREHWLDSYESLRRLTEQQWLALGLPLRIIEEIQKRINFNEAGYYPNVNPNPALNLAVHRLKVNAFCSTQSNTSKDVNASSSPSDGFTSPPVIIKIPTKKPDGTLEKPISFLPIEKVEKNTDLPRGDSVCGSCTSYRSNMGTVGDARSETDDELKCSDSTIENCVFAVEVETGIVDEAFFDICLLHAINRLQAEIPSETLATTVLPTLSKIVDSIINYPYDQLKRKLRNSNAKFTSRIGMYPAAVSVMRAVGFKQAGDFFILPVAYIVRLTDCRHYLEEIAKTNFHNTDFDPFEAKISSLSGPLPSDENSDPAKIQHAIKERQKLLNQGKKSNESVLLDPRVYHMSDMPNLRSLDKAAREIYVTEKGSELEEFLSLRESLSENSQFKCRAKKELDAWNKRKFYEECTIRVQFPDKFILELHFDPYSKIEELNKAVHECLTDEAKTMKWYVYQTPPMRHFNPKKTLHAEDLVPGALVHFKLDTGSVSFVGCHTTLGQVGKLTSGCTLERYLRNDLLDEYEKTIKPPVKEIEITIDEKKNNNSNKKNNKRNDKKQKNKKNHTAYDNETRNDSITTDIITGNLDRNSNNLDENEIEQNTDNTVNTKNTDQYIIENIESKLENSNYSLNPSNIEVPEINEPYYTFEEQKTFHELDKLCESTSKNDEKLNRKDNEKLNRKDDEKLNRKDDEKLNRKDNEKLNRKDDEKLNRKDDEKLNRKDDEKTNLDTNLSKTFGGKHFISTLKHSISNSRRKSNT